MNGLKALRKQLMRFVMDPDCNRIQLNGQHTGFVTKSGIGTGTQAAPKTEC
jgi:hypothetical protein